MKCGPRFPNPHNAFVDWRLAALCLLFLAGCAAPPVSAPASTSSPTSTLAASNTPSPTATEIAEIDISTISVAEIDVLSPGPGSSLLSPIEVKANVQPGADGSIQVELTDAAGRLLVRQIITSSNAQVHLQVPFEISRPPLPARLTLRTLDAFGRIQALNSVDVVLLNEGESRILAAEPALGLSISEPSTGQSLPSGNITLRGTTSAAPGRPLSLQLITRQGRIVLAREMYVQAGPDGSAVFETTFTYTVQEPTWVQIAITELGSAIPGAVHYSAVEVLIVP